MIYGEIIQIINATSLKLCNDLKLEKHIKTQGLTSRKQLRSWSKQFGLER